MILILDGEFGERLLALTRERVWVLESATNRSVAEEIWRADPTARLEMISQSPTLNREDEFARALQSLPLPIGENARLHVIGVRLNHRVREALANAGLEFVEHTVDGFTVRQIADAAP